MSRVSLTLPTEADARRCLAAADASGLSLYAWCRENRVPESTLSRWRKRLASSSAQGSARLVEVVVRPATPGGAVQVTRLARYAVAVNDVTITVGDDFADATLGRLLALARAC